MFGAVFVKDGIGVVDVDQESCGLSRFAGIARAGRQGRRGQDGPFRGRFSCCGRCGSARRRSRRCRRSGRGRWRRLLWSIRSCVPEREGAMKTLFPLSARTRSRCVASSGGERALEFFADVVRIRAAKRHRGADERWRFAGTLREMAAQASFAGERFAIAPEDRRGRERRRFCFPFSGCAGARRGEDEEGLKFAQMKQAHHGVDIGGG